MIRVIIADDQALVRGGFHSILAGQDDIEVVGETADGNETVELVERLQPDVVLMDIRMPGIDGLEATRRIVARGIATRVLVLTTFDVDDYVYEAMKAGASGFLLKTTPPRQLADAGRTVAAGDALLAPSITRRLVEQFVRRPPPGATVPPALEELTERERDVLNEVVKGSSSKAIARVLDISYRTVELHRSHIMEKLRVRSVAELIRLVVEHRNG